jgi:N6-adenosine-specific RNA methylase IME4
MLAVVPTSEEPTEILLCRIEAWKRSIQEFRSVDEAAEVRDQAESIRKYMQKRGFAIEVINAAAELKIRAERRMGELLKEMPKHPGGRPGENRFHDGTSLSDLGIEKNVSHRCQMIAGIPREEFEGHIADVKESGKELTTAGVLRLAERLKVVADCGSNAAIATGPRVVGNLRELIDRGAKFGTIYADPPWPYENQSTRGATDDYYVTMSVEEICAEPVGDLASDGAHLHLWTTVAFIREAFVVMEKWGFDYRSMFVWNKPQFGIGNYWRLNHEILLLGVKGKCPFRSRDERSCQTFNRREHSAKPDEIRQIIEKVSPGPYLEMYGRSIDMNTPWTVYGNQVVEREFLPGLEPVVESQEELFS